MEKLSKLNLEESKQLDPYRDDPIRDPNEPSEMSDDEKEDNSDETDEEEFCSCSNCPSKEKYGEQIVCCMQISKWQRKYIDKDVGCILELENFKNVFNSDVHDLVRIMMSDILKDDNPQENKNRRMRYAAYRSVTYFIHGKLGRRNRIRLPSCVGQKIRDDYPNPPGVPYTRFQDVFENSTS